MVRKTARVLITFRCNRRCEHCCNKYSPIIDAAKKVEEIDDIPRDTEVFCVTGGEPTLFPEYTMSVIKNIKEEFPAAQVFLYTALYKPVWTSKLIELVDGVQFTLHAPANKEDLEGFAMFQECARLQPGKSFRLYIQPGVDKGVTVYPAVWSRVDMRPWIVGGNCPLPPGETLYVLKDRTAPIMTPNLDGSRMLRNGELVVV